MFLVFISFEAQGGVRLAKDIKGCSRTQLLRTRECAISEMKGRRLFINQFQFSVSIWVLHTWHAFMQTLHSHSECFLAHRMVKNDQYTVKRQAYLSLSEKKSKETDFWDKSLTLKSTGWMESEPYFLVGWIGLLRTASYYTILAVCCILMQ